MTISVKKIEETVLNLLTIMLLSAIYIFGNYIWGKYIILIISFIIFSFSTIRNKGKYKINVCLGSACSKNNSNEIMNEFERLIGIKSGQTTSDMKFSLDYSRCVGVCRKPPIITVNGRVYESVTPEDIPSILKNYK